MKNKKGKNSKAKEKKEAKVISLKDFQEKQKTTFNQKIINHIINETKCF